MTDILLRLSHRQKVRDDMTKEEIISGLQFTVDMFLLDPNTGETYTEPRNDMDKTTIDACKGAIELLEQAEWIPCSERLPNDRNWYLGIFKEPDTDWINPLPFICDYVGRKTKATTKEYWILRGITDEDDCVEYYYNLECVAWMPLPEPYKAE